MSIYFGTWADRDYGQLKDKGLRQVHHAQRLIQTKYPNPVKCPKAEADLFHFQAEELVRREDAAAEGTLPLLKES